MQGKVSVLVAVGLVLGACTPIRSDSQLEPFASGAAVCNAPGHHCRQVVVRNGAIAPISDIVVNSANHQIYWEITTQGYVFPTNRGIEFKNALAIPRDEFTCNRITAAVYHCSDRNTQKGKYDYKVTVRQREGAGEIVLDPSILND